MPLYRCRLQSEHDGGEWQNVQVDYLGTVKKYHYTG